MRKADLVIRLQGPGPEWGPLAPYPLFPERGSSPCPSRGPGLWSWCWTEPGGRPSLLQLWTLPRDFQ